jgi:hypothetical protein
VGLNMRVHFPLKFIRDFRVGSGCWACHVYISPLWCSRGLGALGLFLGFCGFFLGVVFEFL